MDDFGWSLVLFQILVDRPPRDIRDVMETYGTSQRGLRVPLTFLPFLNSEQCRAISETSHGVILCEASNDVGMLGRLAGALIVEAIGEIALTFDHRAYLLCLCIARRGILRAHLDIPWCVCFTTGSIPRVRYPIPLLTHSLFAGLGMI